MTYRALLNATVSRRAFLVSAPIMAVALPGLSTGAGEGAQPKRRLTINPDLLRHVHPDVRYTRVELPEERNAYGLWAKAGRMLKSFEDFVAEAAGQEPAEERSRLQEAYHTALDEGHPFPSGRAGEVVKQWLKTNEPAMKLVSAGLARGRLQFSERLLLNYFDELDGAIDPIVIYREFARLMLLRAKLLALEGEHLAAGEELARIWQLGTIVVEGEGFLLHHLIGCALKRIGNEGIRDLAQDRRAPAAVIGGLKQKLRGNYPTESQFAQTLRVEFCYLLLSQFDRLPEGGPLGDLVDALIGAFVLLGPPEALTSKKRIKELRQGLLRLLDGHPAPLDKTDTVRIYSREMAALIADLGTPHLKRNREIGKKIAREVEAWPKQLSLEFDIGSLLEGAEKQEPLSEQDLQRARQALLAVKNPVGKHLAQFVREFNDYRVVLPNNRTEMAATEVVLAARLYIDKHRQLPQSLRALVDEKLLAQVPEDPFAGKPLSYSREKGIIWSYGRDEKDDGGDWDWEAEIPEGEDVVWKLPRM